MGMIPNQTAIPARNSKKLQQTISDIPKAKGYVSEKTIYKM